MDEFPEAFDLTAVEIELGNAGILKPVANLIRRALSAQSCAADLAEADECRLALEHLLQSRWSEGTRRRAATEAALLTMAVLLYARATATSGQRGERGSIQITSKLTPEQLVDHKALIDVRNRALAHVYANEELSGHRWHTGSSLLLRDEKGWLPAAASSRVQLDRQMLARLSRMLPVALPIVTYTARNRIQEMGEQIAGLRGDDLRQLNAVLSRVRIDLPTFFGSVEAARTALAGRESGSASFYSGAR